MSTQRQPKGIPVGGQFAANEHDEALSSLSYLEEGVTAGGTPAEHVYSFDDEDDPEYHGALCALSEAARNGDEEAIKQRRELIDNARDSRGYESIGFETVHVPREVTQEQALLELNADLSEARRNGALDPSYAYSAESIGSEVRLRMIPLVGRKPLRTHFANQTWMRLERRADSYRKNGVGVTLDSGKPWLVI